MCFFFIHLAKPLWRSRGHCPVSKRSLKFSPSKLGNPHETFYCSFVVCVGCFWSCLAGKKSLIFHCCHLLHSDCGTCSYNLIRTLLPRRVSQSVQSRTFFTLDYYKERLNVNSTQKVSSAGRPHSRNRGRHIRNGSMIQLGIKLKSIWFPRMCWNFQSNQT